MSFINFLKNTFYREEKRLRDLEKGDYIYQVYLRDNEPILERHHIQSIYYNVSNGMVTYVIFHLPRQTNDVCWDVWDIEKENNDYVICKEFYFTTSSRKLALLKYQEYCKKANKSKFKDDIDTLIKERAISDFKN